MKQPSSVTILGTALFVVSIWLMTIQPVRACWSKNLPPLGDMTRDYALRVGSTLDLNCTLTVDRYKTQTISSSDLMIKFNNTEVDSRFIEIVDDKTIRLQKPNATTNDTGIYYCYLKLENDMPLVCLSGVHVGYPPLPVENFTCIGYHLENFTCTWDAPWNPVKTKYFLLDYMYSPNSSSSNQETEFTPGIAQKCPPELPTPDTNITWYAKLDLRCHYRREALVMEYGLNATNALGTNIQYFKMYHPALVIFSYPDEPNISAVSSTSVTITWKAPKELKFEHFSTGVVYNISCRAKDKRISQSVMNFTEKQGPDYRIPQTKMIPGLIPYVDYEIWIRCRSAKAEGDDKWSPTAVIEARTLPEVPSKAPDTSFSAYEISNNGTTRSITVYWKPVHRRDYYGAYFSYFVKVLETHINPRLRRVKRNIRLPFNKTVPSGNFSATFYGLDVNTAYEFRIHSQNEKGISDNFSSIAVNKAEKIPSPPTGIFALSPSPNKYEISWHQTPSEQEISKYIVFWCATPRPSPCGNDFSWEEVPPAKRSHTLYLNDGYTYHQFGVAANTIEASSGIVWATCVSSENVVLDSISLKAEPVSSTSVKLIWTLNCKSPKETIVQYLAHYCITKRDFPQTCEGHEVELPFRITNDESYELKNLKPNTHYRIKIKAATSKGYKESDVQFVRTLPGAPDDPPRDVSVVNTTSRSFTISWLPSTQVHGNIMYYKIDYNGMITTYDVKDHSARTYEKTITRKVEPYRNYTILVYSCIKQAEEHCSPPSDPAYALTDIEAPGGISDLSISMVNETAVQIRWPRPLHANGPIDHYLLYISAKDNETQSLRMTLPASELAYIHTVSCPSMEGKTLQYNFSIQPFNKRGNELLPGPVSAPVSTVLCTRISELDWKIIVGIVVGCVVPLIALIMFIFIYKKRLNLQINNGKLIVIKLPEGLEKPSEGGSTVYEDYKKDNGVNRQDSQESRSSTSLIQRVRSMISVNHLLKYRHGSGNSQASTTSADALLTKHSSRPFSLPGQKDGSDGSTGGHDSVSSSITNKTHLSCDSGTELDLQPPPSPDSVFQDLFQNNNNGGHPLSRSCKLPSLPKVDELEVYGSKDSGIGKGDTPDKTDGEEMFPYAICCSQTRVKSTEIPAVLPQSLQQLPYSKMALKEPTLSPYMTMTEGTLSPYDPALANSEPSLMDAMDKSEEEKELSPYLKFPAAKSLGNIHGMGAVHAPGAYSKLAVAAGGVSLPDGGGSDGENEPIAIGQCGFMRPYSKFGIKRTPYVAPDMSSIVKPIHPVPPVCPTVNAVTSTTSTIPPFLQNSSFGTPYSKLAPGDDGSKVVKKAEPVLSSETAEAEQNSLPPSYSKLKVLPEEDDTGSKAPSVEVDGIAEREKPRNKNPDKNGMVFNRNGYVVHADVAAKTDRGGAAAVHPSPPAPNPKPKQNGYVPHETAFSFLTSLDQKSMMPSEGADDDAAVGPSCSSSSSSSSLHVPETNDSVAVQVVGTPSLSPSHNLTLDCSGMLVNHHHNPSHPSDDDQPSDNESLELISGDSSPIVGSESQILVPLKPATSKNGYISLGELPV